MNTITKIKQKLFLIFDKKLLPLKNKKILLAISGGPDSKVMLEFLAIWPKRNFFKFFVSSIDHSSQIESKKKAIMYLKEQKY